MRVNADHWQDFHLLADHTTKLKNFTMGEIHEFSAFPFSFLLIFEQTLSNLIVCLMISQKNYIQKLHKQTSILQWILGRLDEFEMRLVKKSN